MKIHFVDFVEPFLVKNSFIPKLVQMVVKSFGIIVLDDLFNFEQLFFSLDGFELFQQINLSWSKNSCLFHVCLTLLVFCKITIFFWETATFLILEINQTATNSLPTAWMVSKTNASLSALGLPCQAWHYIRNNVKSLKIIGIISERV